jgi:hypothetical protein
VSERFFNFEQKAGDPMIVGDFRIIPFAQTLRLHFPRWRLGGLIWNRPSSVMVITRDGEEQVLPIHDVTRRVQLSLLGAGILSVLLIRVIFSFFEKD